jgi:site-specific recombinase XerD
MADRPDDDDVTDKRALTAPSDETQVTPVAARDRLLTRPEFQGLAEIPPAIEWFANIENQATKRAYRADIQDFCMFVGLQRPEDMRLVTRAHVIAWRDHLKARELAKSTIRRKLSALSSLFDHLAEKNAVADNPVNGVQRPKAPAGEGLTPRISDDQAKRLIEAPSPITLKGKRDRAILATLLFHGLRRAELSALRVQDLTGREGIPHLRIEGKGDRIRFLPAHPLPVRLIGDYLEEAGHGQDLKGPLFRPLSRNLGDAASRPLAPHSIARDVVRKYAEKTGIAEETIGVSPHAMRVTAVSNARDHGADLDDLQHWAGHANISTTRLYIRRQAKPEDSPTFKVRY